MQGWSDVSMKHAKIMENGIDRIVKTIWMYA
jgi:hypothetical protein